MPSLHPGIVPEEAAPDEAVQPYKVHALVMNVVRGKDKWGNPDAYTYNRGDTIKLTPSYAKAYVEARLLEPLPIEDSADDEPKPPRRSGRDKESPDGNESGA